MKNMQKCDAKLIEDALNKLGMTNKEFADQLGVQSDTVRKWFADGQAPKYALLCVEALQRRSRQRPEQDTVIVIRTKPEHVAAFKGLADGVGAMLSALEL